MPIWLAAYSLFCGDLCWVGSDLDSKRAVVIAKRVVMKDGPGNVSQGFHDGLGLLFRSWFFEVLKLFIEECTNFRVV